MAMWAIIRGREWKIVYRDLGPSLTGLCDPPESSDDEREIMVNSRSNGKDRLETVIHEALHAFDFEMPHKLIDQFGSELADILWRMGYRRKAER